MHNMPLLALLLKGHLCFLERVSIQNRRTPGGIQISDNIIRRKDCMLSRRDFLIRSAGLALAVALPTGALVLPEEAEASYCSSVERWRPTVKKLAQAHGVKDQKAFVAFCMKKINAESRGNEKALSSGGTFHGLLQFTDSWVKNTESKWYVSKSRRHNPKYDWRFRGESSIHRMVHSFRRGGWSALYRHWGH